MLRRLSLLALALVLFVAVMARSSESDPPSQAERVALEMDAVIDRLGGEDGPLAANPGDAVSWIFEVVPFFEYEGVTDEAKLPEEFGFQPFLSGGEHNHIWGRAFCTEQGGGPIEINGRVANYVSARYGEDFLGTLVHELAHVQGGGLCGDLLKPEEVESTTQIVTLEILAALANQGNKAALLSFAVEMRALALGAAYYEALDAERPQDYYALYERVSPGATEQARAEKSRRYWKSDPAGLEYILKAYSQIPFKKIMHGVAEGEVPNLALPRVGFSFTSFGPIERRALVLDDVSYLFAHIEKIASEVDL